MQTKVRSNFSQKILCEKGVFGHPRPDPEQPPHVHCIVAGGALKDDGSAFVRAPKNFLFPVRALSRVFREKYLDALQALQDKGKLDLAGQPEFATEGGWQQQLQALRTHAWVVCAMRPAKRPFAEREHLLRYLGRYVNRIAIANHRNLRGQTTFMCYACIKR
jgi:hypothetical protein